MKKQNFNSSWTFFKENGDSRVLDLPHDAMIEEKRSSDNPSGTAGAYFPGGKYAYEKEFFVNENSKDKYITFQFEGVYKNAKVYINGKEAGGKPYGYIPFFVETNGLLKYGENNIIRVETDNSDQPDSRWYTGSGIYRSVWMWQGESCHIRPEGVKISTLSYSPAKIKVCTEHTGGDVSIDIFYKGTKIASGKGDDIELDIPDAKLWSDETPELYTCGVTLYKDGVLVDEMTETFGIRMLEWSAQGFLVNGKNTLLRGGCVHHDNGILGARCFDKSEERKVRIIKEAGFNAIRASHNPLSTAMINACDKYGVYFIDETWDSWYFHKSRYDYGSKFEENYKYDITAMVNRDYNHPSVIMYSIGNEVSEPYQEKGIDIASDMISIIHKQDNTRPVTCGTNLMIIYSASKGESVYSEDGSGLNQNNQSDKMPPMDNSTMFNMMTAAVGTGMNNSANSEEADKVTAPFLDMLDIAGYNYASGRYSLEGKLHPERVVFGSETFPHDIAKNWSMVKKYPYLIGDFMWTAWDYIGEAGIGTWAYTSDGMDFNKPYPWLLADTGAIDILGNVGAEAEYAAVVWGKRKTPYIGVQPVNHPGVVPSKMVWRGTNAVASWTWNDCEGNDAVVEVYSDAHSVQLWINDSLIDTKVLEDCKAVFETKYVSGVLKAVALLSNGTEISASELVTDKGNLRITAKTEDTKLCVGDIAYIDIELVRDSGAVESNCDIFLDVEVSAGTLLASGSANPRTEENYTDSKVLTYYGKAQAVVKADTVGTLSVKISGENLEDSVLNIEVV